MVRKKPLIGITADSGEGCLRLRHYYPDAIVRAGGMPVVITFGNDPRSVAEVIDGLLIPGGDDIDPRYFSERPHPSLKITPREKTDFEIALLKAIMEVRKPVLGICYGMQLINVALGGSLYQDIASVFPDAIDHRKGHHRIVGNDNFIKGECVVNTSHHQAVRELGRGLRACALSDDTLIEAVCLPGYPFLIGVQWHPERSADETSRSLFGMFTESACGRK